MIVFPTSSIQRGLAFFHNFVPAVNLIPLLSFDKLF